MVTLAATNREAGIISIPTYLYRNSRRETQMIGFESEEVRLRKFRERLRTMGDEELIQFGLALRRIPWRVSGVPDPFDQLAEARAEWRRRHPKSTS